MKILSEAALSRALALRDLTDPSQGPHAVQRVLDAAVGALARAWRCEVRVERQSPLVSVADNYDALHYPAGGAAPPCSHPALQRNSLCRTPLHPAGRRPANCRRCSTPPSTR